MRWAIFFLVLSFSFLSVARAAPLPEITVSNNEEEQFVSEQFCFIADFKTVGDTGYGPYIRLFLQPDFSLASAALYNILPVDISEVGTVPAVSTDPVSGELISGPPGSTFYVLKLPVGSVTNGGAPLNTHMCIDVDSNATINTPQPQAIQMVPVFEFGATATGSTPVSGPANDTSVTPIIITYAETDLTAEDETPPGPAFTYDIELVADIAADKTVSPVVFPQVALTGQRQFVGPIDNIGGVNCTATVTNNAGQIETGSLPFSPTHMSQPGGFIDVSCASGTGTTGSDRDVIVTIPVYPFDILDVNSCRYETNEPRNISKHMVIRKSASTTSIKPGDTVTFTLSFSTSEYLSASNITIEDILPDGLSYTGIQSMSIDGTAISISPTINNNTPSAGATTVNYDISSAYGSPFAPTTSGIITYTATVDELYANGSDVQANDELTNRVEITHSVVGGTATNCTETSSETLRVVPLTVSKTLLDPQPEYTPGSPIGWRLRLNIPSGDARNIEFSDYLPLPVLFATDISTNTNLAANPNISLGPNDTLGLTPLAITVDAASNVLSIKWPDVSSTQPEVIEVDFNTNLIFISTEPFADNLFLTNIFEAKADNTRLITSSLYTGVSFTVRAPSLTIDKTVTPTSGVDAGDTLTYRVDVENIGGSKAYDVNLRDILPPGLSNCSIISSPAGSGDFFSASGYVLDNPIDADSTLSMTFSCTIDASVQIESQLNNTAYVLWSSAPGAGKFPEESSSVSITVSRPDAPIKSIVSTDKAHTADNTADTQAAPRPVSIGETIRYRLLSNLPEGTANNTIITDRLPGGLQYLVGTARIALVSANGITSSLSCTTGSDLNQSGTPTSIIPSCGIAADTKTYGSGTDPVFTLGDLVNTNNNPDSEYIIIEFDALVINSTENQESRLTNNRFFTSMNGLNLSLSNAVYTKVVEPQLTASIDMSGISTATAQIAVTIENTGQAKAFQITGENGGLLSVVLPSQLKNIANLSVTITGDVAENATGLPVTVNDFSVSGVENRVLTFLKTLQLGPGAQLSIHFDASTIPGTNASASGGQTVIEYASQQAGDENTGIRTASDLNTGNGNVPIDDKSMTNDYRIEAGVDVYSISGTVFEDVNADALLSPGEAGINGVTVVLYDPVSNTCNSVTTDNTGNYRFIPVAPGTYQLIESALENHPYPSQCVAPEKDPANYISSSSNTINLTVSNQSLTKQNFADIRIPLFELDNSQVIAPNTSTTHPHVFTATSAGNVSFYIASTMSDPVAPAWNALLYLDSQCNGLPDDGDLPVSSSIPVQPGDQICILNKVIAPSNATPGSQHTTNVQSDFTFGNGSTGINNIVLDRTDVTRTVSGTANQATDGEAKLVLVKSVWNVTRNIDGGVALPGETLRYTIHYENVGNGMLNELVIHDSLPEFTALVTGSMQCVDTPAELPACMTSNDSSGGVSWSWNNIDRLLPGSTGSVSYDVTVE